MKWFSFIAAIAMLAACFFPWVIIPSKGITISGVAAEHTTYGKPGYLNILLTILYLIFTLTPRLWARRINLVVAVVNMAWAIRNFLLLSRCEGGECPDRQTAFFIYLLTAVLMMLGALLTPVPVKNAD